MITIASPLAGWVTALEGVPDPVFAEHMLGEGMAVDPIEGRLVAPARGIVDSVHEAGHAVTLAMDDGPVLLMHIGLDTVTLRGKGFRPQVKAGQRVDQGDPLILFDLDLLARSARSLVTPIIVTNGDGFRVDSFAPEGPIRAGEPLLTIERANASGVSQLKMQATVSRTLRVLLAHGLHARPAARLAKSIAPFDADVEIVAEDGRVASARSPVAMLGLGLRHGAAIVVRAGGADAEQAVGAFAELLESGMGELQPVAQATAPARRAKPEALRSELQGIAAVPGLAIGPAWLLKPDEIELIEDAEDAAAELSALTAARGRVQSQLEAEAQGDDAAARIAEAHLAMIADPMLDDAAQRLISSGKSAAFAWREAIGKCAAPLRTLNDARFAERLDDLLDLEGRVLRELTNEGSEKSGPPQGVIVVGDTIYPSQLKRLAEEEIAGIATAAGGATSHSAIIAAGLGLPMIVGLGPTLMQVEEGAVLVMRGEKLVIAPSSSVLENMRDEARRREDRLAAARARADEPAVTADGKQIEVFANLGSVAEAAAAVAQGAEGCGLLRTEFLFLDRDEPPGEEEQRDAYQAIADTLGTRPLIIRTLDIGADKPAAWLPMNPEDNPALGLRGIRLQLARSDLLEIQLRALVAVRSQGPLRIMLPMVSTIAEVRETKALLHRVAAKLGRDEPELGIMVETPAAALLSPLLAEEASFFSIGSNDLSQYALARDRTNPAIAAGLDGLEPPVLRLIHETVKGAGKQARTVGVCGGLAADIEAIPILVGLGVSELSVPPGAIAEVKAIVRRLDRDVCSELASEALAAPDAGAVRALVTSFLEQ